MNTCELCGRERELTFHHLIPRTLHTNKWFKKTFSREEMNRGLDLCRDCHSAIHTFIPSEKELGRAYDTREKLLAHEPLARYVAWVSRETKRRSVVRTAGASGRRRRA
ncbi:MAG: hypothetical protein AB7N76_09880 [Planctomycetota bacterium]